jgi:hypothetical protein
MGHGRIQALGCRLGRQQEEPFSGKGKFHDFRRLSAFLREDNGKTVSLPCLQHSGYIQLKFSISKKK